VLRVYGFKIRSMSFKDVKNIIEEDKICCENANIVLVNSYDCNLCANPIINYTAYCKTCKKVIFIEYKEPIRENLSIIMSKMSLGEWIDDCNENLPKELKELLNFKVEDYE
jgi:hypothetical protein